MSALLHAELLKLRTTRTFVALVATSLAISLLVVVLTATLGGDLTERDLRDLFSSDFSGLFILLLGVMGMAGEWRHRTITSTVLAAPDRTRLVAAKLISFALAGLLMSLVITSALMLVGTVVLSSRGLLTLGAGELADVLWRNLVVAAAAGALGVCIGGVLRNQVAAIVGVLIFSFALEPAVVGLAPSVGRFGPLVGAPSGVQGVAFFDDLLAPGPAVLVLAAWVAVGSLLTVLSLRRRDLT